MKVKLINDNFTSNYLSNLLSARGVENIGQFLHPSISNLLDPSLLDNIDNGAILLDNILNKQDSNILLIVDADIDGYTSAAIIYLYIKAIKKDQNITYLLHEHKQHGLQDHIQTILDSNTHYDLIILPDSSSNDYEYHEQLKELNTKCLVIDHHEIDPNQLISDNACIINNQLSPKYTNKHLTGAGVTWQFCRYHEAARNPNLTISSKLIDLAALGICGDMGSVLSLENRYIMSYGFSHITNYFFKSAVAKQAYSMNNEITPISVAFYIVPMINALIRVGTMDEKERLFLGLINGHELVPCNKRGAKGTMEEVAIESLRECTNAKAKQNRIADQMVSDIEIKIFKYDLLENKILFIQLDDNDDYPSEIVGLCANKIANKYKRPTIITRLGEDGYNKGSIRNISNCQLEDFRGFLNNSGYFEYAQGHASAAGACILNSNIDSFHQYANKVLKDINFNEGMYEVNFIRNGNDEDLVNLVYELASDNTVYGQENSEPLIYIHDIILEPTAYSIIGTNKDTIKFEINGIVCIKFHVTEEEKDALKKANEIKINLIGKPNINTWMGKQTPQVLIEDWEIIDNILEF